MTETINGRATFTCEILSTAGSYRPAIGAEAILTEGGTTIFGGYIDAPAESGIGASGETAITTRISCVDYNSLGDRQFVIDGGFPAGYTMLQCITSLCGYLTAYGVTVDAAQATGPALTAEIVYDVKSITAILDELAVVFSGIGGVSYIWRIDPATKALRMYAVGTLTAPVTITEANRYAEGDVTVEPTRANYANSIILQAGTGTSEVTDSYTATASQTVFPLTYALVSHRGYVGYGTGPVVNEPIGVTTPPYWVVDTAAGTLTRSSGATVSTAITITYIAQFPYTALADAGAAAADVVMRVVTATDIFSAAIAEALADGYLARLNTTSQTVKYRTRQLGIKPGQTQTITVSKRNISGTFLITDVQTQDIGGNVVVRTVTAVSGSVYQGSWRDDFGTGSGGSSAGTTVGSVTVITGSGIGGTGTAGKLPKWATSTTLGDSLLTESGSTVTVAGTMAATTFSGSGASLTSVPAGQLTGTITSTTQNLITRTGTLVSGATGAGFTIALTTSTVTGNLPYARMPSGTGTWTAVPTITGILTLSSDATVAGNLGSPSYTSQTTGWRIDSAGGADFRYLFVDEMHAKSFIADLEQALAGGQIVSKSVAMLNAAVTMVAAGSAVTIYVRDLPSAPNMAVFETGDTAVLRSFSRASGSLTIADAVGTVSNYGQFSGFQSWLFTRLTGGNAGTMATSTVVAADSLVIDYGVSGNGYYEVNAIDGTYGVNSPYAQIVTWATSPIAANKTVRARFGKLTGITGTAAEFGLLAGTYAATNGTYFRASNTAFELHGIDLKLFDGATNTVFINHTTPSIALGNPVPTAYGTGTGIWMGKDTTYKFRVGDPAGDRLTYDGALTLVSNTVNISSTGIIVDARQSYSPDAQYAYGFDWTDGVTGGMFGYQSSTAAIIGVEQTRASSGLGPTTYGAQLKCTYGSKISAVWAFGGKTVGHADTAGVQIVAPDGCSIVSGILSVLEFGAHTFSAGGTGANSLVVTNTTSGTTNTSYLGAVAGTTALWLQSFPQAYTTANEAVQAGSLLQGTGAGGLSISALHASGALRFYSGGSTKRAEFTTDGAFKLIEISATPSAPSNGVEANTYIKGDKYVLQFNNGGTVRYFYLDLASTSGAWTHTTTAP